MRKGQRRIRVAHCCVTIALVLATAGAARGDVIFKTWPPSYRWHTFYGSSDPESGGGVAVDGASRVTTIGLSYVAWVGPDGQGPLRAFAAGNANAVIIQTDGNGAYRWHSFFPCTLDGVAADDTGNLYVTGSSPKSWTGPAGKPPLHAHPGGASAIVVLKLDANGTYLWHTFYGSGHANYNNGGSAVAGDVWVTGHSAGGSWAGPAGQAPLGPFTGLEDAFVLRLTASGAYQWHSFFGSGADVGRAVAIDGAGDGVVLGRSQAAWNGPSARAPLNAYHGNATHPANLFVLKLRGADGAYQWHTFYGTGSDVGHSLTTAGSDIFVTGQSGAAWNGPAGQPPLSPYLAVPANPYTILALKLDGGGGYVWHGFFGSGGVAGNGVASDGLAVYIVGDSWAAWDGPGGKPPTTPFSGWSSIALLALGTDGAYRGHGFLGTATGAQGVAVRNGAVYVGGTGGATWNGPGGQPPRHPYSNFGDLVVVKVVPETLSLILSDEGTHLVGTMAAAGYGDLNLYDALVAMQASSAPSVAGVITDSFLDAVATCPANSEIFTSQLQGLAAGAAVAVSSDCAVQTVPVVGSALLGLPGTATLATALFSGAGSYSLTFSTTQDPLATWQANGTTYNAFAVAWAVKRGTLRRAVPRHRP